MYVNKKGEKEVDKVLELNYNVDIQNKGGEKVKKDRTEEIRRRAEKMTETFFNNEKEYERGYMLGTINTVLALAAEKERRDT